MSHLTNDTPGGSVPSTPLLVEECSSTDSEGKVPLNHPTTFTRPLNEERLIQGACAEVGRSCCYEHPQGSYEGRVPPGSVRVARVGGSARLFPVGSLG